MSETVLQIQNATMRFGGVLAVNDLSIDVQKGELVALIGPNGAGKTTAFNMITGVYQPTEGMIFFKGEKLNGLRSDRIAKKGIARTFQNIRLFRNLTVLENVMIATHLHVKSGIISNMLMLPNARKEDKERREKSRRLLDRTGLLQYQNDVSSSLPYGLQRRLEIARALATDPTLLLLDEPAAGMNPTETEDLGRFIQEIREEFDLTVFLIEHHMQLVMDISQKIYVLEYGRTIACGAPEEIQSNPAVIKAYLGESSDEDTQKEEAACRGQASSFRMKQSEMKEE